MIILHQSILALWLLLLFSFCFVLVFFAWLTSTINSTAPYLKSTTEHRFVWSFRVTDRHIVDVIVVSLRVWYHTLLFSFLAEGCVSSLVETWRLGFLLSLCCWLSARVSLPANRTFVFGIKLKSQHQVFQKDWSRVCFLRWSSHVLLRRRVQVLSRPQGGLYWFKRCRRQHPYDYWIPEVIHFSLHCTTAKTIAKLQKNKLLPNFTGPTNIRTCMRKTACANLNRPRMITRCCTYDLCNQ